MTQYMDTAITLISRNMEFHTDTDLPGISKVENTRLDMAVSTARISKDLDPVEKL